MAATAAPAGAVTFDGSTSRGSGAQLQASPDGTARRVTIHWRAGCRQVGVVYATKTTFRDPFDKRGGKRIADRGFYVTRYRGKVRVRNTVAMTAHRVNPYVWKGSFRAEAVVRKAGRIIDRCTLGKVDWKASIPSAAIHMDGDPGDSILAGTVVDVRTPQDNVPVSGNKRYLSADAGPYSIDIEAPPGRSFKPGLTFKTTRYPFNEGGGLSVFGDGRGCNTSTGTVSVGKARIAHDGTIKHIVLSFEQHCDGVRPALRGTLRYRR